MALATQRGAVVATDAADPACRHRPCLSQEKLTWKLLSAPAPRRFTIPSDAIQRVLAFGALIVLIMVFSLASPNFLQFDNVVGILLSTAVNGVLALGVTFIIITGGIDLSVGTVMTLSAVMTGVIRHLLASSVAPRYTGRHSHGQPRWAWSTAWSLRVEGTALHCHARHAERGEGPGTGNFRPQADLLQRTPDFNTIAMGLDQYRVSRSLTWCWYCSLLLLSRP